MMTPDQVNDPKWEATVARLAAEFPFPPTPDLAASVRQKTAPRDSGRRVSAPRRTWAAGVAAVMALLLLGVLAVPQSRAAVWAWVTQIGAVRIFVDEAPPATVTAPSEPGSLSPSAPLSPAGKPVPLALLAVAPGEPIPLESLDDFAAFPVWRPPVDSEWGEADEAVIHSSLGRDMVTLVWHRPDSTGEPYLTLSLIDIPQLAYKVIPQANIQEVRIRETEGLWLAGPHTFALAIDGQPDTQAFASNVLLWTDDQLTYRIEGDIELEEAIRMAESLEVAR